MNIKAYEKYFKGLAESHVDIRHAKNNKRFVFSRMEAGPSAFKGLKGVVVVLNEPIGRFSKDGNVYLDNKRGSFEIHVQVPNKAPIETRLEASSRAEEIGKSFTAKMRHDRESYDVCPHVIQKFNPESVVYEHAESVMENFVTCIFSFDIVSGDEDPTEYNPNLWL